MEGPAQPVPIGPSSFVRFASELGMFVALGFGGALIGDGVPMSIALAVALPAVGIAAWGAFVAPRARRRWTDPARLLLEVVLFAAACAGLVAAGHWPLAVALAVAYLLGLPHRTAEAAALLAGRTT